MLESKHTATPWSAVYGSDNGTGNYPADVIGPTGHPVAHIPRPDPAANGDYMGNTAFICRVVNAHAALIEALTGMIDMCVRLGMDTPSMPTFEKTAVERARDALALATSD